MLRHAVVTFLAIFFAELPDKTMFATLLLSTRFKRKLPAWIGVSSGYGLHVVIAVLLGSALSNLPERPIQLAIGALFTVVGSSPGARVQMMTTTCARPPQLALS